MNTDDNPPTIATLSLAGDTRRRIAASEGRLAALMIADFNEAFYACDTEAARVRCCREYSDAVRVTIYD
ncbi:MAG: hypothetical protein UZ13_02015 [Chloroflexi bacterium OLB13]|nr:MAG: hypothetical protein UZ13_02015 [Chloroflexi bacterium OLB13]